MINKEIITKIKEFSYNFSKKNEIIGHGYDHFKTVAEIGLNIANSENMHIRKDIIELSAYLIDIGVSLNKLRNNHIKKGIEIAKSILIKNNIDKTDIDLVIECIRNHEAEIDIGDNTIIEAKIIRESDTIDRMGYRGIKMTLMYGKFIKRPLFNHIDMFCKNKKQELDKYTFDYISYLISLFQILKTKKGKELGLERLNEIQIFKDKILFVEYSNLSYECCFNLLNNLLGKK